MQWFAFRTEAVVNVIKNVLGKTFSAIEIQRCVDQAEWATKGKAFFYDICLNSWPIANTVHDDLTNANTLVPLTEDELLVGHLREYNCVFVQQRKFNDIITSVEKGSVVNTDYHLIEIDSANPDVGRYNFFNAVVEEGWFGYRASFGSTFGKYCGASNEMQCGGGTDLVFIREVVQENEEAGFDTVQKLYSPESLRRMFGYEWPDIDSLPPAIKQCPFAMRNGEDDLHIDFKFPPWYDSYYLNDGVRMGYGAIHDKDTQSWAEWALQPGMYGASEVEKNFYSRANSLDHDDDEQSSVLGGPSPTRRTPSSSPAKNSTSELGNSSNGSSPARPSKRSRDEVSESFKPTPLRAKCPFLIRSKSQSLIQNNILQVTCDGIYTDATGALVVCGKHCDTPWHLCETCRSFI
jgi:hypothetical protein